LAEREPAAASVAAYARERKVVVGLSGATDWIADGERSISISNGHPLMAKVTAMGCAASALVSACLAVEPDALKATAAALLMVGVAGEMAAANAQGPGTFAAQILDALYGLDEAALVERAKIEIHE
jgi:hydroxyethylthiazole kinase